jgi:hypothetical protein
MVSEIPFDVHFFKNDIQMSENFSFDDRQAFKKIGVNGRAEEKIHHHSKVLVVIGKVVDVNFDDFLQGAVGRLPDDRKYFFKNSVRPLPEGFHKERLLIRKMLVNDGGGNARPPGDGSHGHFVKRFFSEFFFRGVDDHVAPGLSLVLFKLRQNTLGSHENSLPRIFEIVFLGFTLTLKKADCQMEAKFFCTRLLTNAFGNAIGNDQIARWGWSGS